jgi:hypothetical protein
VDSAAGALGEPEAAASDESAKAGPAHLEGATGAGALEEGEAKGEEEEEVVIKLCVGKEAYVLRLVVRAICLWGGRRSIP